MAMRHRPLRIIAMASGAVPDFSQHPSPVILGTLIVMLAASAGVFWALVRRQTRWGSWVALSDWAAARGMRVRRDQAAPTPLDKLSDVKTRGEIELAGRDYHIVQLATESAAGAGQWHVLLRALPLVWPATALRPVNAAASLVDLPGLVSFPTQGLTERFLIFGTDARAAGLLALSSIDALLPPDVGFLLLGATLILDFSARPFDTVEFDRMIAVAEQLASHLPRPPGTGDLPNP